MKIEIFVDDNIVQNLKHHLKTQDIEKFLEEITYDRVRNAILTLCNTKTDKEIEEDYHGLYALILTDINFTKRHRRANQR